MNTNGDEESSDRECSEYSSTPPSLAASEASHRSQYSMNSLSSEGLHELIETVPTHNPIAAMRLSKQVGKPGIEPESREASISQLSTFDPSGNRSLEEAEDEERKQQAAANSLRSTSTCLEDDDLGEEIKEPAPSNYIADLGEQLMKSRMNSNLYKAMEITRHLLDNVRPELYPHVNELNNALIEAMCSWKELMDRVEEKDKKRKVRKKKKKKHSKHEVARSGNGDIERRSSLKPTIAKRLSLSKKH